MSLNKTLNRLFDEIRREAKRNDAFADRLDAVLRAHDSARDVSADLIEQERSAPEVAERAPTRTLADLGADARAPAAASTDLNPVAFFTRDGADALKAALAALPESALAQLLGDHNLDPAGAASGLAKPALVDHIVAQAQKRVERDRKLFDY